MSLAVAGMMASASPVKAQVLYGSIVGNVKDAQGAVVPGATVTITNKQTGLTRDSVTDDQGSYTLTNVLPGPYNVKVSLTGFREAVRANVPVTIGQISRVDLTLEVGALTESGQRRVGSRAAPDRQGRRAHRAEVRRDHGDAAQPVPQLPGAPQPGARRFSRAFQQRRDRHAGAVADDLRERAELVQNSTRTDGATNVNIWLPNHLMYVAPAETIDTVNVATNNFDAEQGMAGGASITVVTKSGTNQVKGSAFEFHNNEGFNATQYLFGTQQGGKPEKLPVTRNIFGGTVGGPILKNKLFYFGSFEGYRQTRA